MDEYLVVNVVQKCVYSPSEFRQYCRRRSGAAAVRRTAAIRSAGRQRRAPEWQYGNVARCRTIYLLEDYTYIGVGVCCQYVLNIVLIFRFLFSGAFRFSF